MREADGSDSRRTCQKLVPITIGKVTVSLAGAGDGDLNDAFVERLRVNYLSSEITSLDACSTIIKNELYSFSREKGIRSVKGGVRGDQCGGAKGSHLGP